MTTATPPELEPTPPSPSPPPSPPRRRPTIVQDHPGDCPICGMALEQVEAAPAPAAAPPAGPRQVVGYRSPMDPSVISPTPRKDEMGMDYLPVYRTSWPPVRRSPAWRRSTSIRAASSSSACAPRRSSARPSAGSLRVVGRIAIDETRVRHVNVKNAGFVERIFVNYLGQAVKRGDPLFTLFSPELLAAQEEYLLALRSRSALAGGRQRRRRPGADRRRPPPAGVVGRAGQRAAQARGHRPADPGRDLLLAGPRRGHQEGRGRGHEARRRRHALRDRRSQLGVGGRRRLRGRDPSGRGRHAGDADAGRVPRSELHRQVAFIAPMLDPQTRTVKVRLSFANPSGDLRPRCSARCCCRWPPRRPGRAGRRHPRLRHLAGRLRRPGQRPLRAARGRARAARRRQVEVTRGVRAASGWSPAPTS
jgi:Cu(I)/Ag(I) efflux system membrane fusion protein